MIVQVAIPDREIEDRISAPKKTVTVNKGPLIFYFSLFYYIFLYKIFVSTFLTMVWEKAATCSLLVKTQLEFR